MTHRLPTPDSIKALQKHYDSVLAQEGLAPITGPEHPSVFSVAHPAHFEPMLRPGDDHHTAVDEGIMAADRDASVRRSVKRLPLGIGGIIVPHFGLDCQPATDIRDVADTHGMMPDAAQRLERVGFSLLRARDRQDGGSLSIHLAD